MSANVRPAALCWSSFAVAVSALLLLACGHREQYHRARAVWSDDDTEWLVMVQHTEYTESLGDSSYDYEHVSELWRVPAAPPGEVVSIRSGTLLKRWDAAAGTYLGFLKTAGVIYYERQPLRVVRRDLDGNELVGAPASSPIPSPDGKFLAYVGADYSILDRDTFDVSVFFRDGETFQEFPMMRLMMKLTDEAPSAQTPMKPYVIWLNGKLYVTSERHAAAFTPPDQVEYPVEPPCWGKTKDEFVVGRATSTSDVSSTGLLVNAHAESMLIGSYDVEPKYGVKLFGYPDWCTAQK